jgi:hypothetical protein
MLLLLGTASLVVSLWHRSMLDSFFGDDGSGSSHERDILQTPGGSRCNEDIFPDAGCEPCAVNKMSLAFQQSYGFFDDLSDVDWVLRQERARHHEHHLSPRQKEADADAETDILTYFVENYYPLFTCPHQERVGGIGDGPK